MLNQVILVGRLTQDITVRKIDENRKVANVILAVKREFKNYDGIYEVDFIRVTLWDHVANLASTYCQKGYMVAIKGRLQVQKYPLDEEKKLNILELVGEKVISVTRPSELNTQNDDEAIEIETL